MRLIFIFLFFFKLYSIFPEKHSHFQMLNSINFSYFVFTQDEIFSNNRKLENIGLNENINNRFYHITELGYFLGMTWKGIYLYLEFDWQQLELNEINTSGVLNNNLKINSFIFQPEIHYRFFPLSLGFGYNISLADQITYFSFRLYHLNSPFFKAKLDQQWGKLPVASFIHYIGSFDSWKFDNTAYHHLQLGIRFELTYYVNAELMYTRMMQSSSSLQDNIMGVHLEFRITPKFSVEAHYHQLIYTENRHPYTDIRISMNYLHDFHKKKD